MAHANAIGPEEVDSYQAIFSIGSNCGNRQTNVSEGLSWLDELLGHFRCSTIYATPDCHGGSQEYLNAVAVGMTKLSPEELNRQCKEFEAAHGRDTDMRKTGKVPVDIDLVIYDNEVIRPNDYKREFFQIGYRMI